MLEGRLVAIGSDMRSDIRRLVAMGSAMRRLVAMGSDMRG
jgi:hypothetical protein